MRSTIRGKLLFILQSEVSRSTAWKLWKSLKFSLWISRIKMEKIPYFLQHDRGINAFSSISQGKLISLKQEEIETTRARLSSMLCVKSVIMNWLNRYLLDLILLTMKGICLCFRLFRLMIFTWLKRILQKESNTFLTETIDANQSFILPRSIIL